MRTRTLIGAGFGVALAATAAWGYQSMASAQPYGGWGMMGGYGPGYGHMGGYGPGMMGGYGPGMMGGYGHMGGWGRGDGPGAGQWNCPAFARGNGPGYGPGYGPQGSAQDNQKLNLTTDDVKTRMERWLAREDNPRLKLGDVKEKDADTITADVVTTDNSLVDRFTVDRHTGFVRRDNS